MIRGNIAIPDKDPRPGAATAGPQPAIASAIVAPPPMKRAGKGPVIRLNEPHQDNGQEQPQRSASRSGDRSNAMLAHLAEDITDEERNRRADLAVEMFREIKRRAAATKRD
jgi:hypothetical protein